MPNTSPKPRPIRRDGVAKKSKFKLLVLWQPPAGLVVAGMMGLVLAVGGVTALRYSNAQTLDPAGAPAQQQASLLWQDAPSAPVGTVVDPAAGQNGPLSNWALAPQYVYGGGKVAVVSDPAKSKALQFSGLANQFRTDGSTKSQRAEQVVDLRLEKGKTYWFGYDLLAGDDTGIARTGWQSVWQIVPQPQAGAAKLWQSINTRRDGLGIESSSDSQAAGGTPYNTWKRVVVGVSLTDDGQSWVEVWQDGQNVLPRKSLPQGALAAGAESALLKFGVYRSPQIWDINLKLADLRVGTNKEAVQ